MTQDTQELPRLHGKSLEELQDNLLEARAELREKPSYHRALVLQRLERRIKTLLAENRAEIRQVT